MPLHTAAAVSESHIQTSTTVESTGNGMATVEISNTTVIDGKKSSYYFSTSSVNTIDHRVSIQDGKVTFESTAPNEADSFQEQKAVAPLLLAVQAASRTTDSTPTDASRPWLLEMLNYLYFYVEQRF